ncbi:hypothetical protein EC973_007196 [Apophysomyces ossiformis]|uniref:Antiviral helicase n=1 Tax=Apophysomyces ossiformis TaxID=679940 RepID=A0A8H7BV26_9FUNG|nr:hypothetical protein EC973_007196 [Apophysomyces ossiformis]
MSSTTELLEQVFSRLRGTGSDAQELDILVESEASIKADLEAKFLTPQRSFNQTWLSKCQEHWTETPDFQSFSHAQLSKSRTSVHVARRGFDGDIIGYRESVVSDPNSSATNSTSLTRTFGSAKDFVRGKAAQFPFAPGGLEHEVLEEKIEEEVLDMDLDFLEEDDKGVAELKKDASVFNMEDIMKPGEEIFGFLEVKTTSEDILDEQQKPSEKIEEKGNSMMDFKQPPVTISAIEQQEVDSLLPVHIPPAHKDVPRKLKVTPDVHGRREWAHEINVNQPFDDFHELVPEMAHHFPFELDTFQKHAVYHLEIGDSVFVAAHTSAGKTVVADYAIALASKHMTKAIYTSPIKALSNQKFRDFKQTFGEDVGILTGDVQIRPEASCLVMTTEILRSMLYRGADLIRDVEFVIFDEVHYVNDLERGVVWEEVIIMLPAHVNIILLSATVPNTREFADWVGRTKKKDIYVISTLKRPVPLEHHLYAGKELFKIVAANETKLDGAAYKMANDALAKRKEQRENSGAGARGGARGRGVVRGGSHKPVNRSYQAAIQTDRNLFVHLIGLLNKKSLLPVVIFTFSKKRCEEYASSLSKTDLCTSLEKSEIHVFIERSLVRLRGTDKELPQILRMRDLLSRGIAVHHGGLLPIIKEIVEILFARGLVKVLFATETFAMGVNMPARSVVFSGLRKHDGRGFRDLLPGEYTQMSGRAGRRGLDNTGMVIIACSGNEAPEASTLSHMLLGKPTKLESQFRLTYNMILNLLRVEALKVEEMIKRSFSENSTQKLLPDTKRLVDENEQKRSALRQLDCTICGPDLDSFYDACGEIVQLNRTMMVQHITKTPAGHRVLNSGRLIVINTNNLRNAPAVLLKPVPVSANATQQQQQRSFYCLALVPQNTDHSQNTADEIAPLPITLVNVPAESKTETIVVAASDILFVTRSSMKVDPEVIISGEDSMEMTRIKQELETFGMEAKKGGLVEFDWSKIKDIEFQEMLRAKSNLFKRLRTNFQCIKCPDIGEHYALVHAHKRLSSQIDLLKMTISDQNLELLPDYHQRIEVLKRMQYIDEQGTVQLKGRVACEINSADELLLTELVLDNVFADYEPAEIVAILSAFVFQERNASEPRLTPKLTKAKELVLEYARKVAQTQVDCGLAISVEDYANSLQFGLVEVVYEWARGLPFKHITDLTDVLEGSIVRCISRLDETCREVMGAARMVGDTNLYKKMEQAEQDIKRDIVFAASLVCI